jgi:hypothetical protein
MRNRQRADTTYGIFSAEMVNGKWTNITPFRFNRPNYNVGCPFLSDDGKELYFVSDNPEGNGGFDIYISVLKNGTWGIPENLGKNINTPGNDIFPFLHSSGRLYFASRGSDNKSDFDIYYTTKLDGVWQRPLPMEEPFNSPGNEYGLILNATMDTGYFVSDRSGSADIFIAGSMLPVFAECKPQEDNDYCFVFYEPNNTDLDTNAFAYEWDMGDGTRIRSLEAEHCFAGPGTYFVQLNVVDKLTKEVYLSQASDSFLVEDIRQPFIIAPDTVEVGGSVDFDGMSTFLPDIQINGYYWDFNDGIKSEGMKTTHQFKYPGVYAVQLGVTGAAASHDLAIPKYCSTRRIVVKNVLK